MKEENKDFDTTMMRVWRTADKLGRAIEPVPRLLVEQGRNIVVLEEDHLHMAIKKWFSNG